MLFEEYNVETALQVQEEEIMEIVTENVAINLLKMGDSIEKVQLATGLMQPNAAGVLSVSSLSLLLYP